MTWHMYIKDGELIDNNELDNHQVLTRYTVLKLHFTRLDAYYRFLCEWNYPRGKCSAVAIKDLTDGDCLVLMLTGHEIIRLPDNACDELTESLDYYGYYTNFTQEFLADLRNKYYY